MSPGPPLVRAVTVRPALPAAERTHVRALLLGLRSRYVVAALAVEHDDDGLLIRYDAPADAPTLAGRLAAGRPLGLPEAVRLAADVAWGLAAAAAAGLSHGRLDATQIVLGDGPARILGVGLGALDAAPPPGTDVVAPEVRAGGLPTEAADLWSLGVLLRDLTAGTSLPFKLADLIARMLDEHPSRRPAAARTVAARLVALRIASPHVEPGPRSTRTAAAPPGPPPPPGAARPAASPPSPPRPAPAAPPRTDPAGPLPRVSALRRPSRMRRPPRPAPAPLPPLTRPVRPPAAPRELAAAPAPEPAAEVAGLAERGRRARATWRRRGAAIEQPLGGPVVTAPEGPAAAAPVASPTPAPLARPAGGRDAAVPPAGGSAGAPLLLPAPGNPHPRVIGPAPRWARRPLAIAVGIAVLIAAGVLVVLATRSSGATGKPSAAPTAPASLPLPSGPPATPSASIGRRIPLPIVAATAPVDPVAAARLRRLALQPGDVAPAATALPVPEQSNFDAVLRALYADCDYFSPVGQPPLAHLFTGFADGEVEVFDDLTTYPTGVPAQVVAGVATAITKCPTISVPSGNASDAAASFAITRIDAPAGLPTDAVALTYERTDQADDAVRAVFLSTATTLRVVLALAPSLGQSEPDWSTTAAHAWNRLAAAR